jgi:hypothetical protein
MSHYPLELSLVTPGLRCPQGFWDVRSCSPCSITFLCVRYEMIT